MLSLACSCRPSERPAGGLLPKPPNSNGGYIKSLWQTRVAFKPGDKEGFRRMRRNSVAREEKNLQSTTQDSFAFRTLQPNNTALPMVIASKAPKGTKPSVKPKSPVRSHVRSNPVAEPRGRQSAFTDPRAPHDPSAGHQRNFRSFLGHISEPGRRGRFTPKAFLSGVSLSPRQWSIVHLFSVFTHGAHCLMACQCCH